MYKSILAISEGGPDAVPSFRLAGAIAAAFGGTVDAVHFSETHPGDPDIAAQAMPFLRRLTDDRLKARARESERAFRELIAPLPGATFTGGDVGARFRALAFGPVSSKRAQPSVEQSVDDDLPLDLATVDTEQRALAEASRRALQVRIPRPIVTHIEDAPTFYPAEEYHQRYYEKRGTSSCAVTVMEAERVPGVREPSA